MAECKNCIHTGVCGKLIFCERDGTVACGDYKDRSNLEEVVRCKDCKHFAETTGKFSGKPCGHGKCMKPFFIQMIVDADGFCSYGERKDNEN